MIPQRLMPLVLIFAVACDLPVSDGKDLPVDESPLAEVERLLDEPVKKAPAPVQAKAEKKATQEAQPMQQSAQVRTAFPPVVGKRYPDLLLFDSSGKQVSLSSFRGQKLLIEPIGMSCAACQAFSGGAKYGGLGGVTPQKGLQSVDELFATYAGIGLIDSDVLLIQIVFYNQQMKAPSPADLATWERHFKLRRSNVKVLGATEDIRRAAGRLIPGFQLVGKDFVLRMDSAGHRPKHNLYNELFPALKR